MKKFLTFALICTVTGCGTGGGSVIEKVKYDFGIGEKPEGYVSTADIVMGRLSSVGQTELKRMNREGRPRRNTNSRTRAASKENTSSASKSTKTRFRSRRRRISRRHG